MPILYINLEPKTNPFFNVYLYLTLQPLLSHVGTIFENGKTHKSLWYFPLGFIFLTYTLGIKNLEHKS